MRKFIIILTQISILSSSEIIPFSIPTIDLDNRTDLQTTVDREEGVYLGHPTTVLLEDGQTILTVYPKGHGKGAIVYKRSEDGGKTWSERLPVPPNWSTSKEVPTIHRVIGKEGEKRLIMRSGVYPARLAISEDDGLNWSPLHPAGDWGGIVVMGFVEPLKKPGHYMAMFHDDGPVSLLFTKPIQSMVDSLGLIHSQFIKITKSNFVSQVSFVLQMGTKWQSC